ncbi:MAG: TRAP transporter small permease [Candidatus Marithrix sp.]
MSTMVISVLWQIISRYFLADPSPWTEELARIMLIWLGVLGGSYAYRTSSHIGIDLLMDKLRKRENKIKLADIIDLCVITFAMIVMIFGGMNLVSLTYNLDQLTAVLGIQMAYIYCVIPLSGVLITIFGIFSIIERHRALAPNSDKESI